ncbi:MAG: cell division protein ZapD [Proteobacteria bacterium]|jgi:cell division protein ZapD|nr:cell division protein ZapD [Pseudomonadota bacterium]
MHNTKMAHDSSTAEQLAPTSAVAAAAAPLIFEQPLNERMRTFLRLDYLYNQALYHNEKASQWGSRAAVGSLIDILAITTRSDVRSEVLKEIERHLLQLAEFENKSGVDGGRLRALINNLTRLRSALSAAGAAYLQPLRDSEFLAAIKHRSAIPGGTCEFDLPDYFFWLNQDAASRTQAFNEWLALLRPLCDAVAEVLWLTRQNGRSRSEIAAGGTFTINFERDTPLQLLRICLPAAAGIYPEISGSHHRCSVRFLKWNGLAARPSQAEGDIPFQLVTC